LVYPPHFEIRTVSDSGAVNFRSRRFQLSTALTNQEVGLEEVEDDIWIVNIGPLILGTLHYPSNTFIDEVRWKPADPPPEGERVSDSSTKTVSEGLPILPV
jgi:hypothetical protein